MRKFLFLIFGNLFTLFLLGQVYYPFPTSNADWHIYREFGSGYDHININIDLLRYHIYGDTVINQLNYKKLILATGDTASSIYRSIGGIREDDEKKIYFIGEDFCGAPIEQEVLLYDFSKKVNDTIYHIEYSQVYSVIINIDSIEICGDYRKRFKINGNWNFYFPDEEYWIEGIGSIKNGLLGHITLIPTCCTCFWEHICFREENVVKYLNTKYSSCFPENLKSIEKVSISDPVRIFPNPTDNDFFIRMDFSTLSFKKVVIYDLLGTKIFELSINSNQLLKIPRDNFIDGVYIIEIVSETKSFIEKLIIL